MRRALLVPFLLTGLTLGCGGGTDAAREKRFKELAAYTPDAVADELVQRFRSLAGAGATAELKKGADAADEKGKGAAKANPFTFEGLITDAAAKVKAIPDQTPSRLYDAIAARIDQTADLPAADRDRLKQAMRSALGAGG